MHPRVRKLRHMSQQPVGIIPQWSLADRMRKAREVTGLDQTEFGERIGASRATVSNAERGNTTPSRLVIRAWALGSGVPLVWLETGNAPTDDGGSDQAPRTGLEPVTLCTAVRDNIVRVDFTRAAA